MSIQLAKWGNALGVRIPALVAKKAHLKPGDPVDFELLDSGEIMLKPVRKKRLTLEQRVAEITDDNRHNETDWGDVQGQEIW